MATYGESQSPVAIHPFPTFVQAPSLDYNLDRWK
jgi:hypothetical protein